MNTGKISDFLELCDKYCCNERILFFFIKKVVFDVLDHEHFASIDIEKNLVYRLKNEKMIPIKIKKRDQKKIEKNLIELLEKRRNKIFLSENAKRIKDFYVDFLGQIARFSIIKINGEEVFLEPKSPIKKVPERLVFMVKIDDFLDQDMMAVGHHFMFFIKNVELKNEKIFIKMTRKRSKILEKELQYVFDFIEKKYGKKIEFKMDFVDFKNKEIAIRIVDETIKSILYSVKKLIKTRLGFDIFWKERKEIR